MIELKTTNLFLMLITCLLHKCVVSASNECGYIHQSCRNEKNELVALCIHTKDTTYFCDSSPGRDVYEFTGDCNPNECPAVLKEYCNPTICKNGGICLNLVGTYSCTCKNGYHGRNCDEGGGNSYIQEFYFIYSPYVKLGPRNSVIFFFKEPGDKIKIEFTIPNSGETFTIDESHFQKKTSNAKQSCLLWQESQEGFATREICNSNVLPKGHTSYVILYYDVVFNDEATGIITTYVPAYSNSDFPGFQVNELNLKVYNNEELEFSNVYKQTSVVNNLIYFGSNVCPIPIKFDNCGTSSEKPLQFTRKDSKVIKSILRTGPDCQNAKRILNWTIYDYEKSWFRTPDFISYESDEVEQQYTIEPFSLAVGLYKVKLSIRSKLMSDFLSRGNIETWFDDENLCFIKIVKLRLMAEIKGGKTRTVYVNTPTFTLDGSTSYDPNYPMNEQPLLKWSWSSSDPTVTCSNSFGKLCEITKHLPVATTVTFTLKLSSNDESSPPETVSQTINVSALPQAQLEIRCLKNCGVNGFKTLANEVVYLEVKVLNNYDVKSFSWAYSVDGGSEKSTEDIQQPNIDSHILVLKENTLQQGSNYTFYVKVNAEGGSENFEGSTSVQIVINKPPEKGNCSISPKHGSKVITEFDILCANFTDDNDISQLFYEFYEKPTEDAGLGMLLGTSVSGELKKITLTESDITIRVYNVYGMYTDDSFRVELQDWKPSEDELKQMINNVSLLASFGDRAGSVREVGAIIYVLEGVINKHSVLNDVLDILQKVNPIDFYDVKLFSSVLNKVVTKGVPLLENGLNSEGAKLMGGMMASLAERLLLEVKAEDKKGSVITAGEINNITMTMLNSSDVIIKSKDESIFQSSTGSLKMFSIHEQYRRGTASMVRALAYSGVAILTNLLPHEKETTLSTNDTLIWLKVESPEVLADLSGIPANVTTKVKVSKVLAKHLMSSSENIAIEVITFKNNPYWWDIQDRDVASEIVSVRAWMKSSLNMKAVEEIAKPIDIYLNIKNVKFEVLSGSVTSFKTSDSDDEKDAAIAVHTLEAPEEDSNGKLYVEFQNLTEDSQFKVLISTNLRPDYNLMMEKSFAVNLTYPSISILYSNIAPDTLNFIGIFIPPSNVTVNKTIKYTMKVYSVQCKVRLQTVWTSPACVVGEETTKGVVHCRCSHLTFFGSSIFVAPSSVHPIRDLHLFINLKDNPLVFSLVILLLLLYIVLLIWSRLQEKRDKLKGKVIVLEDNYPEDEYPYLVAVYTAFNIGAATGATVGIKLIGEEITSRGHILRSKERKVFRRNADDWFLLFTPVHLGTLEAVYLWHDNSGSHPDWYCKKMKVYDIKDQKEFTFLVDQWMSIWPGEYIESVTKVAKRRDEYEWRNVVIHNIIYNFQETHLWLSIFVSHPRATVSKSQRLTMAFCIVMVTFLTSIMFYGIAKGNSIEDENEYAIKAREIVIAIESAILSAIVTSLVITCFKRSQVIIPSRSSIGESEISSGQVETTSKNQNEQKDIKKRGSFLLFMCNFLHSMVKSKPLMPILYGKESSESVIRRRRWAKAGWVISQIIIWGSGFFIILYGLKMGKVTSELWVTSATLCFINGIFLSAPVKIIIFSTALAFFGEMYNVATFECEIESAKQKEVYGDEDFLRGLLELRSLPIYHPLPANETQKLQESAEQLSKNLQIIDFIVTVLLCLTIMNYTAHLQQDSNYFLNSHIESRLTNCLSTPSLGLKDALNVFRLTDYIIVTLLPNLYRERWYNKAKLTSVDESLADMGWVSDAVHRLVGVPQLRQIRVKAKNCSFSELFNVSNAKCLPSLSSTTEDTANYGLNWGQISKYLNKPLRLPFTYQQGTVGLSLMFGASGASYHGGGYTVLLEDTQRECNLVIADLIDNGWWNIHSRAFIVELTLYNPNTDSHSLITIISEHLPSGAFINRIQATTISLSFQFLNFGLFLLILILLNFRLIISINRHGFFSAFSHSWRVYDIALVGVCDFTAVFECIKIIRAATAVQIFQQVGNSNFFNFSNIVFYERVSLSLWCLVLLLAPIRVLKFKPFILTCKAACYTLFKGKKLLAAMTALLLVIFTVEIFVINVSIPPNTIPFDFDTKYYKGLTDKIFCKKCITTIMKSLILAFTCNSAVIVMQVILIVTYKIMSDY